MADNITKEQERQIVEAILPSKEELEIADKHVRMLVFSSGELTDGSEYYAYLAVQPSKYIELLGQEGGYRLGDYGEILAFGETKEAPESVQQEMEARYGADPNFARDIEEMLLKSAEEALKEREKGKKDK